MSRIPINKTNKNNQDNQGNPRGSSTPARARGSANSCPTNDVEEKPAVPPPPQEEEVAEEDGARAAPTAEILNDVVAFVEVYGDDGDMSPFIRAAIAELGANINKRLSPDTTHVVFHNGRLCTYRKARTRNIPIVSIDWFESCRSERRVCDARQYPIHDLKIYDNPHLYHHRFRLFRPNLNTPIASRFTCAAVDWNPNEPNRVEELLKSPSRIACSMCVLNPRAPTSGVPRLGVPAIQNAAQAAAAADLNRGNYSAARDRPTTSRGASGGAVTRKDGQKNERVNILPRGMKAKKDEPKPEDEAASKPRPSIDWASYRKRFALPKDNSRIPRIFPSYANSSKTGANANSPARTTMQPESAKKSKVSSTPTKLPTPVRADKPTTSTRARDRFPRGGIPVKIRNGKYIPYRARELASGPPAVAVNSGAPPAVAVNSGAPLRYRSPLESKNARNAAEGTDEPGTSQARYGTPSGIPLRARMLPKKPPTLTKFTKLATETNVPPSKDECEKVDGGEREETETVGDFLNPLPDFLSDDDFE